jgi:hypothetical protein
MHPARTGMWARTKRMGEPHNRLLLVALLLTLGLSTTLASATTTTGRLQWEEDWNSTSIVADAATNTWEDCYESFNEYVQRQIRWNYTIITDTEYCLVGKNCVPHQGDSDALCLGREANAWYLKTVPFDGTASCSVEYALIEQNEECEISYNAEHGLPFPNFTAPEDWWQHTLAPGTLEFCYRERMPLAPWHQKQLSLNYTVFTNYDDGNGEGIWYCDVKINCVTAVQGDDGLCLGPPDSCNGKRRK